MKPKEYLKQLEFNEKIAREAGVYDEADAEAYRLEGAKAMYMIMSKPWRNAEKSEKRKAQKKKYVEEHKAQIIEYQRKYRAKKKGER